MLVRRSAWRSHSSARIEHCSGCQLLGDAIVPSAERPKRPPPSIKPGQPWPTLDTSRGRHQLRLLLFDHGCIATADRSSLADLRLFYAIFGFYAALEGYGTDLRDHLLIRGTGGRHRAVMVRSLHDIVFISQYNCDAPDDDCASKRWPPTPGDRADAVSDVKGTSRRLARRRGR
jgi:hypothetical protein